MHSFAPLLREAGVEFASMVDSNSNAPSLPRRRFTEVVLGTGLLATAASFLYPILKYLIPPELPDFGNEAVVAAKVSTMKPNEGVVFRFGSKPALLIEEAPGEYTAMIAVCTHLGCTVQYRPDLHEVWCPCHNGKYDVHGRNISGPPPRPLTELEVQVRGDQIYVQRKEES
jgi:cytochrome b6-f complex iron-sulfur subunit